MAYMEQRDLAARAIAEEIYKRIAGVTKPDANPYEYAINRKERATAAYHLLSKITEELVYLTNDECDAATANLRQYESQPGIALPEYRGPLFNTELG